MCIQTCHNQNQLFFLPMEVGFILDSTAAAQSSLSIYPCLHRLVVLQVFCSCFSSWTFVFGPALTFSLTKKKKQFTPFYAKFYGRVKEWASALFQGSYYSKCRNDTGRAFISNIDRNWQVWKLFCLSIWIRHPISSINFGASIVSFNSSILMQLHPWFRPTNIF